MVWEHRYSQSWLTTTADIKQHMDNLWIYWLIWASYKENQTIPRYKICTCNQTDSHQLVKRYILYFKLVAEKGIEDKDKGEVLVLGLDDSLKAFGKQNLMLKQVLSLLLTRRRLGLLTPLGSHILYLIKEQNRQRISKTPMQ